MNKCVVCIYILITKFIIIYKIMNSLKILIHYYAFKIVITL
jgi:hypothetical protein